MFEFGWMSFLILIVLLLYESGLNSNNMKYVKDMVNLLISIVVNWDYLVVDCLMVWKVLGLFVGVEFE